jgi:hypothetical protein
MSEPVQGLPDQERSTAEHHQQLLNALRGQRGSRTADPSFRF